MKWSKISFILVASILFIGALSLAWAQMNRMQGQGTGPRNPLIMLQNAIQRSGAPALSADQQTQLQTLIQNFRSAQPAGPDPNVQSAQQNFESAVLSGNASSATAAADILASATAADTPKHLEALATFDVQALNILQPQASALKQQLGNGGFVALLSSLAGGPGMRGGIGGMGRGRMGR